MAHKTLSEWCNENNKQYLIQEWDVQKNGDLSPDSIGAMSQKKIRWKCEYGHEWEAFVVNRTRRGDKCPYCSGKRIILGVNDLATVNPTLASEWDYGKNGELRPTDVTANSGKRVWWKDTLGHEWQAVISSRNFFKSGCPYCSNPPKRILVGFNDLGTTNPELQSEWNYEKNKGIDIKALSKGSDKNVWWRCPKGHEYQARIYSRVAGSSCPYCSNQKVLVGFNDFETWCFQNNRANLLSEWDYEKNGVLQPNELTPNSGKKVWWKCDKGHEWETDLWHRVSRNSGCPICSGNKILIGFNDLFTTNPELADEWDYEKNDKINPDKVSRGTEKKAWWKCKKGHEWQAQISSRASGAGCPYCNTQSSFPEYAIYRILNNTIHTEWRAKPYEWEIDIYIPEYRIGIEYDGRRWHSSKDSKRRELLKAENCSQHGIQLIRVKESSSNYTVSHTIYYSYDHDYTQLDYVIVQLINLINHIAKTNIKYQINKINWNKIEAEYKDLVSHPENSILSDDRLKSEWNYDRNGKLNPELFPLGSNRTVWWRCDKGHEWQAQINSRSKGVGCPFCANRKVLIGFNDLATTNPDLAKEWNYKKNINLSPLDITAGSNKRIWWECKYGHEWQTPVAKRVSYGTNCPVCSQKRLCSGYNDLETWCKKHNRLEILNEWDSIHNGELKPSGVTAFNGKRVWWVCSVCGNSYQTAVSDRTRGNQKYCGPCSRKIAGQCHNKKVINVETNTIYNSLKDAAKAVGISSPQLITAACKKGTLSGGYHWRFVEPKDN